MRVLLCLASLIALACSGESEPSNAPDGGAGAGAAAGAVGSGGSAGSGWGSGGSSGSAASSGAAGSPCESPPGVVPTYAEGCGACGDPRGAPIGGGEGYPWIVQRCEASVVVSTKDELLAAIEQAQAGDIIYIDDAAEIDLSDTHDITVPGEVTIASGRGNAGSEGALVHYDTLALSAGGSKVWSLFLTGGQGVRFTGFRLRGSDTEIHGEAYELDNYRGITITHDHCEIDNMEISGFSHYATGITNAIGIDIHHNFIHHNRRAGLGYGVVVSGTTGVLVEGNRFDANRHSVAGSGGPGPSYEIRYNWVGPTANGHVFDMHGDGTTSKGNGGAAGNDLEIHHNTLTGTAEELVVIRGVPVTGAFIHHNSLPHASASGSIVQSHGSGNFTASDNCFGTSDPICD